MPHFKTLQILSRWTPVARSAEIWEQTSHNCDDDDDSDEDDDPAISLATNHLKNSVVKPTSGKNLRSQLKSFCQEIAHIKDIIHRKDL